METLQDVQWVPCVPPELAQTFSPSSCLLFRIPSPRVCICGFHSVSLHQRSQLHTATLSGYLLPPLAFPALDGRSFPPLLIWGS